MSENKVADNGDPRRYFTQIPNLIDDTEMSVYAFRLYVHLKRVAGDNGKCWQGTRELSKSCRMSVGKVSQSKAELKELGLIYIETKTDEKTNNEYHEITIVDIWNDNMKRYCSPDEHPTRSGDEQPRSPGERKNNPIKNNPKDSSSKPKTPYVQAMERLESAFAESRGCPLPDWGSEPQTANKRWRTPLKKIWEKCDKDTEATVAVVHNVTSQMRNSKLTFDAPDQILKTAFSYIIDNKNGKQPSTYPVPDGI